MIKEYDELILENMVLRRLIKKIWYARNSKTITDFDIDQIIQPEIRQLKFTSFPPDQQG